MPDKAPNGPFLPGSDLLIPEDPTRHGDCASRTAHQESSTVPPIKAVMAPAKGSTPGTTSKQENSPKTVAAKAMIAITTKFPVRCNGTRSLGGRPQASGRQQGPLSPYEDRDECSFATK